MFPLDSIDSDWMESYRIDSYTNSIHTNNSAKGKFLLKSTFDSLELCDFFLSLVLVRSNAS